MLIKVESLIITSENYDQAISFFKDKLGLEMPTEGQNMVRFELGGFPIFVARSDQGSNAFVSVETDDIETDFKHLKERGIEFPEEIKTLASGDKAAFFGGPVGIDFMLYQPAPE
jgi:hypothetical protein